MRRRKARIKVKGEDINNFGLWPDSGDFPESRKFCRLNLLDVKVAFKNSLMAPGASSLGAVVSW